MRWDCLLRNCTSPFRGRAMVKAPYKTLSMTNLEATSGAKANTRTQGDMRFLPPLFPLPPPADPRLRLHLCPRKSKQQCNNLHPLLSRKVSPRGAIGHVLRHGKSRVRSRTGHWIGGSASIRFPDEDLADFRRWTELDCHARVCQKLVRGGWDEADAAE
jgi:hypothetical protein